MVLSLPRKSLMESSSNLFTSSSNLWLHSLHIFWLCNANTSCVTSADNVSELYTTISNLFDELGG